MAGNYENIPAELRDMPQWVCFKLEHSKKIPYDPRTGRQAKANDKTTWCAYETAVAAVQRGEYDGIGFQFANGVFGIDLDGVVRTDPDDTNKFGIRKEAIDIVDTLDSYAEYSPSGTGIHILCKGTIPPKDRRKDFIEMYSEGRYFTVTGNVVGEKWRELNERTAQAAVVHAKYLARRERYNQRHEQPQTAQYLNESDEETIERTIKVLSRSENSVNEFVERMTCSNDEKQVRHVLQSLSKSDDELVRRVMDVLSRSESEIVQRVLKSLDKGDNKPTQRPVAISNLSDDDLLELARNGKYGERFKALYDNGDISAYKNDHSRADQALVNDLVHWTNGDASRVDTLFRQSRLMRPKWDERRGSITYGELTIAKALKDFKPYVGKRTALAQASPAAAEWNTARQAFMTSQSEDQVAQQITSDNPRPDAISTYLEATFTKDIARFVGFKDRKTGFSNLDRQTGGLYPGLYVIGAISSLGKTTFVHQLGDQLAAAGDHVLYFSLEQSRLEMVTKSLSRITAQRDLDTAVSAIYIRGGRLTHEVAAAAEEYKQIADKVSVIECNFNTNINFILDYTRQYMAVNPDVKPVVIVDYLQIIPPTDPRQSDKEKVDHIVRGLKKLQGDNDLVVFVVSSINRANYLTPIDFESFKESGGIEYTADVVWGLQLQTLNDELFNGDKKIKEKREKVREAKKAIPRKIELACLKNRYGISSYSCGFVYDPRFDLFKVDNEFDLFCFNGTEQQKRL